MTDLKIKGSNSKPNVDFSVNTGVLSIKGKSILEFAEIVFDQMNEWLEEYSKIIINKKITIEIALEYFNSSTAKALIRFLFLAKELISENNLFVNYFYDDENILDYGHDFADVTEINFNFIEKKYH
ncbi:MAG: SiaC family regulatory phosphoprotein [Bacteroidales bacterium]|nr:SiaC family regulatory phosphoprotein [Bacteroidales bacterium]MBN2755916.1 SiaC family regulatory phosphoprotein [Bacteroidales bacterium]